MVAAFQGRELGLQNRTGGVVCAGVLVPLVLTGSTLSVGAGGVDRGHHRSGLGVWLDAGVDHFRFEMLVARAAHEVGVRMMTLLATLLPEDFPARRPETCSPHPRRQIGSAPHRNR